MCGTWWYLDYGVLQSHWLLGGGLGGARVPWGGARRGRYFAGARENDARPNNAIFVSDALRERQIASNSGRWS